MCPSKWKVELPPLNNVEHVYRQLIIIPVAKWPYGFLWQT